MECTLVVGVDKKHLEQLRLVWPTWRRHKPSLLQHPMIVFREHTQVTHDDVLSVVDHPDLEVCAWPMGGARYSGDSNNKWTNPQRHKMLAGFVFVPGMFVRTQYWLKLDTDVVATGVDDWVDWSWFDSQPAIVSQGWHYTKPAGQMVELDQWVECNKMLLPSLADRPPLKHLRPGSGSSVLRHPRIISWCGFFSTEISRNAAGAAFLTCPVYTLPVPSQDGYLWYLAERLGKEIKRVDMKSRGWIWRSSERSIKQAVVEALYGVSVAAS